MILDVEQACDVKNRSRLNRTSDLEVSQDPAFASSAAQKDGSIAQPRRRLQEDIAAQPNKNQCLLSEEKLCGLF